MQRAAVCSGFYVMPNLRVGIREPILRTWLQTGNLELKSRNRLESAFQVRLPKFTIAAIAPIAITTVAIIS